MLINRNNIDTIKEIVATAISETSGMPLEDALKHCHSVNTVDEFFMGNKQAIHEFNTFVKAKEMEYENLVNKTRRNRV